MWGEWWDYSLSIIELEQDSLGVYELGDESKNTVFYGKGKIKTRLLEHLNKKECPLARYYRYELFTTEAECEVKNQELLENYKQRYQKLPMYNEKIALSVPDTEEKSMMQSKQFIGSWKLVSMEERSSNGKVSYPYGRTPFGVIIYDSSGNMSVQTMRSDRPAFVLNDRRKGTQEELKAAFEGYLAYFGTYDVNEKESTVTHHVKGSLFPNIVGSDLVRFFEFSGNRLTLKTPTGILIWERVA